VYARSLYETGQFFESTKKPQASAIYYSQLMTKYPDTQFALLAKKRLAALTRASKKGKSVVQQEEAAPAPEQTSSDAEINPPFSQPDEAALTPPEVDQGPSDSEINPPFSQPDEAALTPPSVDGEINPPFSQSDEAMLAAPEFVDEGELTAEGNDPFDKSIPGGPGSASVIDEVSDEVESLQEVLEEFAEEGLPEAH
jgi:TolA-binding protein